MPNRINMGVRFTSDDISVLMTPAVASAAQGIVSCKFGFVEELYHTVYNAYLPDDNYGTAQAYFTK